MGRTITTVNWLRLGDNLAHLQFLRLAALANPDDQFIHHAGSGYLPQLVEVVADVPNIRLLSEHAPVAPGAVDSWKNAGGWWERHPLRNEYGPFMVEWFRYLAERMGVASPIQAPTDLLFDYPALSGYACEPFDVLLVNAQPLSGQWRGYSADEFRDLANALRAAGRSVLTTSPIAGFACTMPHTVTGIGGVSRFCRAIVMSSSGPSWPTFNRQNAESVALRVVLIDSERVNLSPNTVHAQSIDQARAALHGAGFL